jgi:hypothetical protein
VTRRPPPAAGRPPGAAGRVARTATAGTPVTRRPPPATGGPPGSAARSVPPGAAVRAGRWSGDRGSAVLEFVVVGLPLLAVVLYLAVGAAVAQRAAVGVTEAARQAGRAYVTGTSATAAGRAEAAARAVRPHAVVAYGGPDCDRTTVPPRLAAGVEVTVCVRETVRVLGRDRAVTGRFDARADRFRDYG